MWGCQLKDVMWVILCRDVQGQGIEIQSRPLVTNNVLQPAWASSAYVSAYSLSRDCLWAGSLQGIALILD